LPGILKKSQKLSTDKTIEKEKVELSDDSVYIINKNETKITGENHAS